MTATLFLAAFIYTQSDVNVYMTNFYKNISDENKILPFPYFCKMDLVLKYFKVLSEAQKVQFNRLPELYHFLNSRINLVSRTDIQFLHERHILHSLGIARIFQFIKGTRVLDAGTGGGFPGIPLAIMFPDVHFTLVDSIRKKTACVEYVREELALKNVDVQCSRLEKLEQKFDFVVSRAVTALPDFYKLACPLVDKKGFNSVPNGIIYLKGGDFIDDLRRINVMFYLYDLADYFEEEFFLTKKLVYLSVS